MKLRLSFQHLGRGGPEQLIDESDRLTAVLHERIVSHKQVTNESHENPANHQYTVSIDDVTEELMACTCPHHVHRTAFCKHMTAVENATDNGTFDAFPSEDDAEPEDYDREGLGDFPC